MIRTAIIILHLIVPEDPGGGKTQPTSSSVEIFHLKKLYKNLDLTSIEISFHIYDHSK